MEKLIWWFRHQKKKSLPQKLSEDIIAFILKENLQPGDKLPNETVLSERLNAGRSSVREAMKLLASRNIVTIRQGSGTYIASSPGMVEDPLGLTFIGNKQKLIHDLLEVRFLLEPSIAAMAATRANKKDIKKNHHTLWWCWSIIKKNMRTIPRKILNFIQRSRWAAKKMLLFRGWFL
mgnify:CR=1 FL=1